jgi:DNA-binding NarL/FixJ family response regulator
LPPKLAAHLLDEFTRLANRPEISPDTDEGAELTHREREVLDLVATGATNQEIADRLTISLHTVKSHVRSILSKLHAANRRDAARLAAQQGLLRGRQ